MALQINSAGMVNHPRVRNARSPAIERGAIRSVSGVIVHQTDADTASATLNSYKRAGANGAHFLIDTDGTIYQTASVLKRTNHIGKIKARCIAEMTCSFKDYPASLKSADAVNRVELRKTLPGRYPSNAEAIGIELVGRARLPAGFKPPTYAAVWKEDRLRGEFGVYPVPTLQQNQALKWLVEELASTLKIASSEVFRHPTVSWKNPNEAKGAQW